ncbi:unnamed protein product [Caenorhabditis angaria]|uniref:Uncharacterized protein n=1 Tax=Caenorhabditis angaria TaxID=860376 RepID=A0A9P1MVY5_9PELO|nr:unnamed protein product [Caenorhabditis angaria]
MLSNFVILFVLILIDGVYSENRLSHPSENVRLQIFVVGTVGCFVTCLIIIIVRLMRKYSKRQEKYATFN